MPRSDSVLIHIGVHKTATTFLQRAIWPYVEGYTFITRPYTTCNHAFNRLMNADESLYDESAMLAELDLINAKRLLISEEALSGKPIYFSYINRTMIARRLKRLFPDARIVVCIRDQRDIIVSHYNSYTLMPFGTKAIEDVFYRPSNDYSYKEYIANRATGKWPKQGTEYFDTNDIYIHMDCFRYSKLISTYFSIFDDVNVILYEQLKRDPRQVLRQLSQIARANILRSDVGRSVNASPPAAELERRRRANQFGSAFRNRYMKKLARSIARSAPVWKKPRLIDRVNALVDDYYREDNCELKDLLPTLPWTEFPDKYR